MIRWLAFLLERRLPWYYACGLLVSPSRRCDRRWSHPDACEARAALGPAWWRRREGWKARRR